MMCYSCHIVFRALKAVVDCLIAAPPSSMMMIAVSDFFGWVNVSRKTMTVNYAPWFLGAP
eukprot:scaffold15284_cov34-Cylindrotheca_fusiformis.AAC.1